MKMLKTGLLAAVALLATSAQASILTFNYTGALTTWTASSSGVYRVTAVGAQGVAGDGAYIGGRGAYIAGDFTISNGSSFQIAVGGAAPSDPDGFNYNGGGGGGTFFVDFVNNPLLVAGGGGGSRAYAGQGGTDASITPYAYDASGSNATYTPTLKTTDLGLGGIASSFSWGSAGAGFYGDGADDSGFGYTFGTGGKSWANGLAGGVSSFIFGSDCDGPGGFGGGGSGAGCGGGGGGGGYSGGDGGYVGGGGGSWNTGANQIAIAGYGYRDGWLTIEQLSGAVPEPASWALMITGFGLVGSALRRRRVAATA